MVTGVPGLHPSYAQSTESICFPHFSGTTGERSNASSALSLTSITANEVLYFTLLAGEGDVIGKKVSNQQLLYDQIKQREIDKVE